MTRTNTAAAAPAPKGRKSGPVKSVQVDPTVLAGAVSPELLASLLASVESASAAKVTRAPRVRISLQPASVAACEALGWEAPYADTVATIKPQLRDTFKNSKLSPLYDNLARFIISTGELEFGTVAQLYQAVVAVKGHENIRSFSYILQQVSNRIGRPLNIAADKVTLG